MYLELFFFVALAAFVATAPQPAARIFNGTAIPIMKRSMVVNDNKTVDLDLLNAHVASVHAKILRGFENYERNTGENAIALANSTIEKRWNEIVLNRGVGQIWFGPIWVGTLAKIFFVVFDTASSELFLPSISCDETCDGHNRWDPGESLTSQNLESPCNVPYGRESTVTGGLYTDIVSLAGFSFTANRQTFCAASTVSLTLQSPRFIADGVMGMAFPSVSSYGGSPVFQTLISQGEVTNEMFSFLLSEEHGELYINGANAALYSGQFTFVPVLMQGFWMVPMDSLEISGVTITRNAQVIIDTGSLTIDGPTSQIAMLHTHLDGIHTGNGVYEYPCNYRPIITLTFGDTPFSIPPGLASTGLVDGDPSRCVSGFVGLDLLPEEEIWIIGEVFLRNVYTTFNVADPTVGFARLAGSYY